MFVCVHCGAIKVTDFNFHILFWDKGKTLLMKTACGSSGERAAIKCHNRNTLGPNHTKLGEQFKLVLHIFVASLS